MTTAQDTKPRLGSQVSDFFVYILGQLRTVKKIYPGVMHLLIFWGVIIQVIGTAIKMMQMGLFVPFTWPLFSQPVYFGYEVIMDLAGVMILVGVLMAAFRRLVIRPSFMETRWDDIYALSVLFLLPVVGFVNEGLRLVETAPAWANWSFAGNILAGWFTAWGITPDTALAVHPYIFWTHVGLGLALMLSVPYTKLRHLVATPVNILLRTTRPLGETETIPDIMEADILGTEKVSDFHQLDLLSFDACLQCGRCEEVCPATISGMPYSPRVLLLELWSTMAGSLTTRNPEVAQELPPQLISEEFLWACTTCGACLPACPAFIRPPERVIDIRRSQVLMSGNMPKTVGDTLRNIERQSNPWGMPPQNRTEWIGDLDVRILQPGDEVDVLFFVGCAGAFDDRNQKVTRAFVRILNRLGVDFGILGLDENCCGETARRMGNEYLFQVYAEENIAALEKIKFNKIVTQCPHGYNTLKHEYPVFGGNYRVLHSSEYLIELLADHPFPGGVELDLGRLTYHDSCYLGRFNDIYSEPRNLLKNAHLKVLEMQDHHEKSFCCGGGGGAMWLETDAETRINQTRLEHAKKLKADTITTACPYCLIMLDDAIRSKGLTGDIRVLDVSEVLDMSME